MLITFNEVSKKYLDKDILKNASFTINDTDKIGLVGINGAGKSTLLKLITNEIEVSSGTIFRKNDLKISYLPQQPHFDENNTIISEAIRITKDVPIFEVKSILSKFGLDDFDKLISNTSGGEKRRLSLATTLLKPCELLILDEPTNHLDIWMINWLEKYLMKWNKGLLLVTHDRYFLERITSKTLEIELGKLYMYDANYSNYLLLKQERLEYLEATNRKLKAILKKEAEWAALNPQARSTKSTERLERFHMLEEKMSESNSQLEQINKEFNFTSKDVRLSKKTIILENISKNLNGKTLFSNLSYNVTRLDRLGIVGANGSGKSTLFKVISGEILPDTGFITIGETVRLGYLKQEDKILNSNKRIIDYIKEFGEVINTKDGMLTASQLLENFLFSKTMQYMPISSLSGGEKRRLQVVSVLIKNPNILLLDEPTNDLDIYTLEVLEDYIENFLGAVIVISHDRYFLDKVTDHYFIYEDDTIKQYTGLISDYITSTSIKKKEKKQKKTEVSYIPRFTSAEKKEFDQIENSIYEKEEQIMKLTEETYNCGSDYEKLLSIQNKLDEENEILNKLYERYEYLNNINDEIIKYKKEKLNG